MKKNLLRRMKLPPVQIFQKLEPLSSNFIGNGAQKAQNYTTTLDSYKKLRSTWKKKVGYLFLDVGLDAWFWNLCKLGMEHREIKLLTSCYLDLILS